jgi:aryl-alcohol dehydrogenase-like predicted oxidoreductase
VLIATKVGMLPDRSDGWLDPDHIAAACEASLRRLGVDHIDLYYAHRDDETRPIEHVLSAFDRLVRDGKVGALGACHHRPERLGQALEVSAREGLASYSVIQPEHHLLKRGEYDGRLQQLCIERGVGVLPFYGLANGFFTGKYRSEADKAKSVRGDRMGQYMNERGWRVLATLDELAAESGATQAQIALAWVAAQPGVAGALASATSVTQLDELIGVMTLDLTEDQLQRLDEVST